jgi:hypothetical protein
LPSRPQPPNPQPEEEPVAPPDLDQLARQILPRIKRIMAVERERQPAW